MITPEILALKVLVLDDMEAIRTALIAALKTIGFTDITEAVDGFDGLEKVKIGIKSKPFGLVFSDVKMPRCDGIEFLKILRSVNHHATTPVIMVTSEAEVSTVLAAIQAGANSYVLKPFTAKTVEQKIIEVFTKIKATQK